MALVEATGLEGVFAVAHEDTFAKKNSESHASPPFRYVYCVKTQVKNAGHRHAICIEKLQAPLDVFTGAPLCGATQ